MTAVGHCGLPCKDPTLGPVQARLHCNVACQAHEQVSTATQHSRRCCLDSHSDSVARHMPGSVDERPQAGAQQLRGLRAGAQRDRQQAQSPRRKRRLRRAALSQAAQQQLRQRLLPARGSGSGMWVVLMSLSLGWDNGEHWTMRSNRRCRRGMTRSAHAANVYSRSRGTWHRAGKVDIVAAGVPAAPGGDVGTPRPRTD